MNVSYPQNDVGIVAEAVAASHAILSYRQVHGRSSSSSNMRGSCIRSLIDTLPSHRLENYSMYAPKKSRNSSLCYKILLKSMGDARPQLLLYCTDPSRPHGNINAQRSVDGKKKKKVLARQGNLQSNYDEGPPTHIDTSKG